MRPRRIAQRKKESPISVAPPPTLPTPVCSTVAVAPVVDDESPRSPSFAEQIALAADELQSPRSPTFEEQITECRRTLKPTPPPSPPDSPPSPPDFRQLATTTVAADAVEPPPTWCFGGLGDDGSDEEWTPTCTEMVSVSCF